MSGIHGEVDGTERREASGTKGERTTAPEQMEAPGKAFQRETDDENLNGTSPMSSNILISDANNAR